MDYPDLMAARAAYEDGRDVVESIRQSASPDPSSGRMIEVAYDLQAGSYVEALKRNRAAKEEYASQLASHLQPHLGPGKTLLDIGTGELTTLSLLAADERVVTAGIFAFDISWSRLSVGLDFWADRFGAAKPAPTVFCADIGSIPLHSKSIDVVTSSHALEPNGTTMRPLLEELFRVCRDRLVLFEPSYELDSEEGRARMDRHGYIRGLPDMARTLGATVESVTLLDNPSQPLNPTACYVISRRGVRSAGRAGAAQRPRQRPAARRARRRPVRAGDRHGLSDAQRHTHPAPRSGHPGDPIGPGDITRRSTPMVAPSAVAKGQRRLNTSSMASANRSAMRKASGSEGS